MCLSPQLRLVIRGAIVQSEESVRANLETEYVTKSVWSPSVSEMASTARTTGDPASKTLFFHGHETKKENNIFILIFNDGREHFMFSLVYLHQCSHVFYSFSLCVFIC